MESRNLWFRYLEETKDSVILFSDSPRKLYLRKEAVSNETQSALFAVDAGQPFFLEKY